MITVESQLGSRGEIFYLITLFEPGMEKKGRKFEAHSVTEIHDAIDHYFGMRHTTCKSERRYCPLCREGL